jgi:hypothetical protein
MRALTWNLCGLGCAVALMVAAPTPGLSQPSLLAFGQMSAGGVEQVDYRYRRHRYGSRPYYRPYYRPYAYYPPHYGSYSYPYYPYYYRPYYGSSVSFSFGF